MGQDQITSDLNEWKDIAEEWKPTGILIGNGASRTVSECFAYPSLFEIAKTGNSHHRLTDEDCALFESLDTSNFERVLSALSIARLVNKVHRLDSSMLDQSYRSIRLALVEAVQTHHVEWVEFSEQKSLLREALRGFDVVYSTNYDLLVYWAIMSESGGEGFKDFFWSGAFDLADTKIFTESATRVLYLHGGIHLCRASDGRDVKRKAQLGTLLETFGKPYNGEEVIPLFVAEGTAKDKLRSIGSSSYLSFAYSQLGSHRGPLCIFGHSLAAEDEHIVKAIGQGGASGEEGLRVAISIRASDGSEVIKRKAHYIKALPDAECRFFDAGTHPLGDKALRVRTAADFNAAVQAAVGKGAGSRDQG